MYADPSRSKAESSPRDWLGRGRWRGLFRALSEAGLWQLQTSFQDSWVGLSPNPSDVTVPPAACLESPLPLEAFNKLGDTSSGDLPGRPLASANPLPHLGNPRVQGHDSLL